MRVYIVYYAYPKQTMYVNLHMNTDTLYALLTVYVRVRLCTYRYRQEGSTLLVSHVVPADEGEYQCVVTNMANQRVSPAAILTVFGE